MNSTLRQLRIAPFRAVTSIIAIALAIAAIGVFAIPGVTEHTMRDIAATDGLGHMYLSTSPMPDSGVIDEISALDGVDAVSGRVAGTASLPNGDGLYLTGIDPSTGLDRVRLSEGRQPRDSDELVATKGLAAIGERIAAPNGAEEFTVVGIGTTTALATDAAMFGTVDGIAAALDVPGPNRITVTLDDPTESHLNTAVAEIRTILAAHDVALASLPTTLPGGAHPIEEEIEQVSFMIGSLGVIAGLVALVLLSSTANTVVTERTRDAAVLRSLGGSRRQVRRELRRFAVWVGVAGTVIGIPFGIVVANTIARMVLEKFAGITPSIGVSPIVIVASAAFGILGARAVSGRVARRVVRADLPTVLRDQQSVSFGDHLVDRWATRIPARGLSALMVIRGIVRQRSRSISIAAQVAGAVAATVLVASLATSIADFNEAELASYRWDAITVPSDPVYPFAIESGPASEAPGDVEVGIVTDGLVGDWEIEMVGVDRDTAMLDTDVTAGRWLAPGAGELVLAAYFANQEGFAVGDVIDVELPSGTARYDIVGLHPVRSVAAFVDATQLSATLGSPGFGNISWTTGAGAPPRTAAATETTTRHDLFEEDAEGRDAIIAIFTAIGLIVVSIAALGATSTVAMSVKDRRAELATLAANGARPRNIRQLLGAELLILAIAGWIVGVGGGLAGASAIMGSFQSSNAVELGFTPALWEIPATAAAVAAVVLALAAWASRSTNRRSVAAVLRASA